MIFFKVTRVRRARRAWSECMACESTSHELRTRPRWRALSVTAACCSDITRPLGLELRSSLRNEARAVESHSGSNDRHLITVLLSAMYSRNSMHLNAFCMCVGMHACCHAGSLEPDATRQKVRPLQTDATWHAWMPAPVQVNCLHVMTCQLHMMYMQSMLRYLV